MKNLLLALVAITLLAALPVSAQEAPEPARCDATLVTLLVVALTEYDYTPPMRLDLYDFGEYRTLVASAAGVELPERVRAQGPSAGDQAEALVNEAATELAESGLGALGDGLSQISGAIGDVVDAGEEAIAAGQDAIEGGAAALDQRGAAHRDMLVTGALPGEASACGLLRADLLGFMLQRLGAR